MKNTLYIFLLYVVFTSCGKENEHTQKINSLLILIDSCEKVYQQIDTGFIKQSSQQVKDLTTQYKQIITDSLDKSMILKTQSMNVLNTSLSRFMKSYLSGLNEFEYSRKQLEDLKKDIQNHVIVSEDIVKYLKTEEDAILKLKQYVHDLKVWEQNTKESKNKIVPEFISFLDSLKK